MKAEFGKIVWFTGLSGSGKSTLAVNLKLHLKKLKFKVFLVDGDKFRKKTKNFSSFNKLNILKNNLSIIKYVKRKQYKYHYILVAVISPLKASRSKAKKIFLEKYYEIYTRCHVKYLRKRDTKGLYKLADEKKIKNLIGYKSKIKYENSEYKVLTIDTSKLSIKKSIQKIFKIIK